ncbi:Pvc16 family protein [Paraburkholderia sp. CNPSo 3274]|uniref:Pvc16 family protein n=1 Tax=Paraburkholderia sp. CNPSo 3274 TaxID=2940932 RepID=UPI0020B73D52|nr:Pvc16 family protein [Paraburkholderia sp. CNPSo 3274]MCP3705425.1 Pvc16 family protein [Paraburkholderia sp. CNPSo 3274]
MSDYFAVAAVTAVMRTILQDALAQSALPGQLANATITALPPDRIVIGNEEKPQLNLFLYRLSSNTGWCNEGLPSRDASGQRIANPPLALNLHYMMSVYGPNPFDGELLLAWAMQIWHETPVLTRDILQTALTEMAKPIAQPAPEEQALATTTLPDQVELIKLVQEPLGIEELSKMWTAFQVSYRPTVAYQASVVLIQRRAATRIGPPVQKRHIKAVPWRQPVIEDVSPAIARTGDILTLRGRNFIGDTPASTGVSFDGGVPVAPAQVQGNALRVQVPASLPAGIATVAVRQSIALGDPPTPHVGSMSNLASFTLAPTVLSPLSGSFKAGTTVTVQTDVQIGRMQSVSLVIGVSELPIDIRPASGPPSSSSVDIPIPVDFPFVQPEASVPLYLRVDGAQSKLYIDQDTTHPTHGQLVPQITVTAP